MDTTAYEGLTGNAFNSMLAALDGARVGLIGDLCLDMYWEADMRLSQLSRETPHFPLPVVNERVSPGGAGNVAANLAALTRGGKYRPIVLGVIGADWRGLLLGRELERLGVDARVVREDGCVTNAYIKPLRRGISDTVYEDPRIDFENRAPLSKTAEHALIAALDEAVKSLDVLCVCDQLSFGCVTPSVRERIARLAADGLRVIVDSRDNIGAYANAIVKPNEVECARAMGLSPKDGASADISALADAALELSARNGRPALVTLGENGCLAADNGRVTHIPARRVEPPIDICGAGDTFLAALACALAGGADIRGAAAFANLASSVTIAKVGVTGTATREELQAAFSK